MDPKHIIISDIGKVIELTAKIRQDQRHRARRAGCLWTATAWATWAAWCSGTGKHLAEDGMIVVVVSMSGEDGSVVSGPDIITRGFVYVKESEGLMEELRQVAVDALEQLPGWTPCTDWAAIKGEIKNDLSGFLYKKTKRNPMILPVIMEV